MKKLIQSLLLVLSMIVFYSCSDDDKNNDVLNLEANQRALLLFAYNDQIAPLHTQQIDLVEELVQSTTDFTTNPTTASLTQLRDNWKNAFLQWKEVEAYNIGPVQSSFIHTTIHRYPVNTSSIEDFITANPNSTPRDIQNIGANIKGYGTLEYLLFENDNATTLNLFTMNTQADSRSNFLNALSQNLLSQVQQTFQLWETYEVDFETTLESGIDGSFNKLGNAIIAHLETIKSRKLNPVLDTNPVTPENLEARRSLQSKAALNANIWVIEKLYFGTSSNDFTLSSYVKEGLQNQELDERIRQSITLLKNSIVELPDPIEENLPGSSLALENVRTSLSAVIVLFKVDFASAANIVVTFNDNDGD